MKTLHGIAAMPGMPEEGSTEVRRLTAAERKAWEEGKLS